MRKLTEAEQKRITARWDLVRKAEQAQRIKEIDDLNFEAGEHWDADIKKERLRAGRPCLTIDMTSGPIKQVTNQTRSARPGIVVTALGNGATVKTAQAWQGICRRIEMLSNADYAYSWANQYQVKMGRGFWRILPEYIGSGDEQDLRIHWIDNPHTVYLDPTCRQPDGSDRKWGFIVEDVLIEDYQARFPDSEMASNLAHFASVGDGPADWLTTTHVRIAEYFWLEETTRLRHTLSDGSYVFDDILPRKPRQRVKGKYERGEPILEDQQEIVRSRDVKTVTVKWALINAVEALEETTIPGSYIPIVEAVGERRNINGQIDKRGMVRMAKDAQRAENYHESTLVETIALSPKAPWLVEENQIADYREMWATANRKNWDALVYKATSIAGAPVPPPMPITREPPIQALVMAAQRSQMQLRNVMGNIDVMQDEPGQMGGAVSGRAINARKLQQELQSSDYSDNLGRGIRLTGKILLSMVRDVYDTPRIMRIVGDDDIETGVVTHWGPDQRGHAQQLGMQHEIDAILDVSVGDYDVGISVGKSYQSQRQEANDAMSQLFSAAPELAQIGADIWISQMDWPGAQALAARLKKANPLAQDESKKQAPIPAPVQQRLQALDQYAQAAHEQIAKLNEIIQSKQLELQSKEKIAAEDNATKIQLELIRQGQAQEASAMKAELERIALMTQLTHEERMRHTDQAHQTALAAMQAMHDAQAQAQAQDAQRASQVAQQQTAEASRPIQLHLAEGAIKVEPHLHQPPSSRTVTKRVNRTPDGKIDSVTEEHGD